MPNKGALEDYTGTHKHGQMHGRVGTQVCTHTHLYMSAQGAGGQGAGGV